MKREKKKLYRNLCKTAHYRKKEARRLLLIINNSKNDETTFSIANY